MLRIDSEIPTIISDEILKTYSSVKQIINDGGCHYFEDYNKGVFQKISFDLLN